MAYNYEMRKKQLGRLQINDFQNAILAAYKSGVTSKAPLGWSSDTIVLHGQAEPSRISLVSIRNYCGDAELLITDKKGNFLFYGRLDINLGVRRISLNYYDIFNSVYKHIRSELPQVTDSFKWYTNKTYLTFEENFSAAAKQQQELLKKIKKHK